MSMLSVQKDVATIVARYAAALTEATKERNSALAEKARVESHSAALRKEIAAKRAELARIMRDIESQKKAKNTVDLTLAKARQEQARSIKKMRETAVALAAEIDKERKAHIAAMQAEERRVAKDRERTAQEMQELESARAEWEKDTATRTKKIADLEQREVDISMTVAQLSDKYDAVMRDLRNAQEQLDHTESSVTDMQTRQKKTLATYATKIEAARRRLASLREQVASHDKQMTERERAITTRTKNLDRVERDLQRREQSIVDRQQTLLDAIDEHRRNGVTLPDTLTKGL